MHLLLIEDEPDEYKRGTVLGRGVFVAKDVYLFVGRDTATIVATRTRLIHAFGWVTGVTLLLAAIGGIVFSVQFLRRVDAITRTCNAIVAGRFNDRIVLRGNDDELDRLANAINLMLDRIAALQVRVENDVLIDGDRELLTQLFSNLIENALRHTQPGTQVVVSLERAPAAIVASVADSGPGIPENERAKVLRRFYRLNASRSSRGYGLGLALVSSIANLHDASLALSDNAPGLRGRCLFQKGMG